MGTQIYLIRHPQPLSVQGMCYGRRDVVIGTDALAHAAARVREQLAGLALESVPIFSSPSMRCILLAQELAEPRQPTIVPELAEMDFGSWEGLRWDEVPRNELDTWAEDVWRYAPGGAESAAMVAARWLDWSRCLVKSGIRTAVAVTHAGLIRVVMRCNGLLSLPEFAAAAIEFGSVHRIELEDRGTPS